MGYGWALAVAAVLVVLATWCLLDALSRLVWRPRAVAAALRRQGVRGPGYRLLVGSLGDINKLRADAAAGGAALHVASHDFIPFVQPQFRQWIPLYGNTPELQLSSSSESESYVVLCRASVLVLVWMDAGHVRGRRRAGEAGALGQDRAVPQERDDTGAAQAVRQGARPGQRQRVAATQEGRPPGLQHGQAQDDDGDNGRRRTVDGGEVGGAGGEPWREGGDRAEQPVRGADRRRDLSHGVREQLRRGEAGFHGDQGAPVHRLLKPSQHPNPRHQVFSNQEESESMEAGQEGEEYADADHQQQTRRRREGEGRRRWRWLRRGPARADAGGQRATGAGHEASSAAGAEHGRDHRRVQDLLLRRAGDHLAPPLLDHVSSQHAPGLAAQAPGRSRERVRRRRGRRRPAPHLRHARQAEAAKPVLAGDAAAVQPGAGDPEADGGGGGDGRRHGAGRHDADVPDRDDAPRRGGVGRRRRGVRPDEVRRRRRCHGQAAVLLHGAEGVRRAELRHGRGEGRRRRHTPAVQAGALAGVRPRAHRRHHAPPQARPPHGRHTRPRVTWMQAIRRDGFCTVLLLAIFRRKYSLYPLLIIIFYYGAQIKNK